MTLDLTPTAEALERRGSRLMYYEVAREFHRAAIEISDAIYPHPGVCVGDSGPIRGRDGGIIGGWIIDQPATAARQDAEEFDVEALITSIAAAIYNDDRVAFRHGITPTEFTDVVAGALVDAGLIHDIGDDATN